MLIACGALGLQLGACATMPPQVLTEVTRFTTWPAADGKPVGAGRSFAVAPLVADGDKGLEFQAYAELVARQMEAHGFKRAAEGAKPVLDVRLAYEVDGGRQELRRTPRFDYVYETYVTRYGQLYTAPRFAYVGDTVSAYMAFTRTVELKILEHGADGKAAPAFEGRARSTGGGSQMAPVMPQIVASIFQGFPGRNGETYRVTLPAGAPEATIPATPPASTPPASTPPAATDAKPESKPDQPKS